MLVKIVYKDGEEVKVKKGELIKEDEFTIKIQTLVKPITIGKMNLIEMSQIGE